MKNFNFIRIEQLLSPPVQKINYKFSPPPEKTNDAILIYPRGGEHTSLPSPSSRFSTISRFCTPSHRVSPPPRDRENIFPLSLSLSPFSFIFFYSFFFFFGIKTCVFDRFRSGQDPTDFVPAGIRQILTFRSTFRLKRGSSRSKRFPNRFQTTRRTSLARSLARIVTASPPHEAFPFQGMDRRGSTTIGRVAQPLCLDSRYWLWGRGIYSLVPEICKEREFVFFSSQFFFILSFVPYSSNIILEEELCGKIYQIRSKGTPVKSNEIEKGKEIVKI